MKRLIRSLRIRIAKILAPLGILPSLIWGGGYLVAVILICRTYGIVSVDEAAHVIRFAPDFVTAAVIFAVTALFLGVAHGVYEGGKELMWNDNLRKRNDAPLQDQKEQRRDAQKPQAKSFMDRVKEKTEMGGSTVPYPPSAPEPRAARSGGRDGQRDDLASSFRVERYHAQNLFELTDKVKQELHRQCFSNTFRCTVAEKLQSFQVPEEFRSFFLHISFPPDDSQDADPSDDRPSKRKKKSELIMDELIDEKDIQWTMEPASAEKIIIKGQVHCKKQLSPAYKKSEQNEFCIQLTFDTEGSAITHLNVSVGLVEDPDLLDRLKKWSDSMFDSWFKRSSSSELNDERSHHLAFKGTTRLEPVRYTTGETLRFQFAENEIRAKVRVELFSQFTRMRCPCCGTEVQDLGIPALLPYCRPEAVIKETSDQLVKTLDSFMNADDKDKQEIYQMVHRCAEINADKTARKQIPKDKRIEDLKQYIRIPMGWIGDDGLPHAYVDTERKKQAHLLRLLNEDLCGDPDRVKQMEQEEKLYLFKKMPVKADPSQFYIHNSFLKQLCPNCLQALPDRFYRYSLILTTPVFGNSAAGKTVLICSIYNVLKGSSQINTFEYTYSSDSEKIADYQMAAKGIEDGEYPDGTGTEVIPTKISSADIIVNKSEKVMMALVDMQGILSVQNWTYYPHILYVHSMLDDPFSLGEDSVLHVITEDTVMDNDPNTHDLCLNIILTKLDAFPVFLRKRIETLNERWSSIAASVTPPRPMFGAMNHTVYLLDILKDALSEPFMERPVSEVIPESILKAMESIPTFKEKVVFDRSMPYHALRDSLVAAGRDSAATDIAVQATFKYLHGLDVLCDNYLVFCDRLRVLLSRIPASLDNVPTNKYWLTITACSATGYSMIEAKCYECGYLLEAPHYAPHFVRQAHDMLIGSVYTFLKTGADQNDLDLGDYLTTVEGARKLKDLIRDPEKGLELKTPRGDEESLLGHLLRLLTPPLGASPMMETDRQRMRQLIERRRSQKGISEECLDLYDDSLRGAEDKMKDDIADRKGGTDPDDLAAMSGSDPNGPKPPSDKPRFALPTAR